MEDKEYFSKEEEDQLIRMIKRKDLIDIAVSILTNSKYISSESRLCFYVSWFANGFWMSPGNVKIAEACKGILNRNGLASGKILFDKSYAHDNRIF